MSKKIVFIYSGQGSQYYNMGKELYEKDEVFNYWVNKCNEIAQPIINISLIDILYRQDNGSKPFNEILYTHVAIFIIEYSLTQVVLNWGIEPDYLIGYSIGEYTANVVAGVISLENGINILIKQAQLLKEHCLLCYMIGIIESFDIFYQYPEIFKNSSIVGRNYGKHFAITGRKENLKELEQLLKHQKIIYQTLPVDYGFHSKLIDPIEKEFKSFINEIERKPSLRNIISSAYSRTVLENSVEYFWDVVRKTVEFDKTISFLEKENDCIYIDLGPSGTLAGFVKHNLKTETNSIAMETINKFGYNLKSLIKTKEQLSGKRWSQVDEGISASSIADCD